MALRCRWKDRGWAVMHKATARRRVSVYLTEGQITADGERLHAKDQARIDVDEPLALKAQQPAELILIDGPLVQGMGQ